MIKNPAFCTEVGSVTGLWLILGLWYWILPVPFPSLPTLKTFVWNKLLVEVEHRYMWFVGNILIIVLAATKSQDQTVVLLSEKFSLGQRKIFESCYMVLK